MRLKIGIIGLVVVVVALYWMNLENGKQIAALQNTSIQSVSNITHIKGELTNAMVANNQLASALIEVITRSGYTNMIRSKP